MFTTEPPEAFDPLIEGTCCYYRCGERFLFLQNNPDETHPHLWATPGGKIEAGEHPEQALAREIREETGLSIGEADLIFLLQVYIRDPSFGDYTIHLYFFRGPDHAPSVTIDENEHEGYVWATLSEALSLELIPAQREVINYLVHEDRFHDLLNR